VVLVLLIVPALVAIQHDLGKQMAALRKGLRFRGAGLRGVLVTAVMVMLGWLAATLGHTGVTGDLLPGLPALGGLSPEVAALVLFLLGAVALPLAIYLGGGIVMLLRRGVRGKAEA